MSTINYPVYAKEAIKITVLCLIIAAIYKIEIKSIKEIIFGCTLMILSIVVGGIIGYYFQLSAKILTILYAGLAFYLPKIKSTANILINRH